MTTLIAIPYWNVPGELIDKAARHALAQTAETVVLVVGDGQKPPVSFTHDRLVVRRFPAPPGAPLPHPPPNPPARLVVRRSPEPRGPPFVQQAMILGSPFPWYAPHGADDWIEPNHVASLLALRFPVAGSGSIFYHEGSRVRVLRSSRTYVEFGVLDTALLRSIGGYNAAEPCGQDSVLISVLLGSAGKRLTRNPTYHKLHR